VREELPPVVFGVDDRYIGPLCVVLHSLAGAHPPPAAAPAVVVLHRGLDPDSCERLRFHADLLGLRIELRQVGDDAAYLPVSDWASDAVYLRLSIPQVLDDFPEVLYLDSDLLVVDDLRPLLCTPLDGAPLAAVRDALGPTLEYNRGLPGWRELGLTASKEYFNSGVLLLRPAACRSLFADCRRFLCEHPENVKYWDQDGLNAVTGDDGWQRLDGRWNTFAVSGWTGNTAYQDPAQPIVPIAALAERERFAAILHYCGRFKPWYESYPPGPNRDRYRAVLKRAMELERG
jgi:lipopolysaccharide biosynthesis glycosyltransferase